MNDGDTVTWLHVPRGGYGYSFPVDAVVVKHGPKRVLVEARTKAGEVVQRWVLPERLRRRPTEGDASSKARE
jgi:hypothetical protein